MNSPEKAREDKEMLPGAAETLSLGPRGTLTPTERTRRDLRDGAELEGWKDCPAGGSSREGLQGEGVVMGREQGLAEESDVASEQGMM